MFHRLLLKENGCCQVDDFARKNITGFFAQSSVGRLDFLLFRSEKGRVQMIMNLLHESHEKSVRIL